VRGERAVKDRGETQEKRYAAPADSDGRPCSSVRRSDGASQQTRRRSRQRSGAAVSAGRQAFAWRQAGGAAAMAARQASTARRPRRRVAPRAAPEVCRAGVRRSLPRERACAPAARVGKCGCLRGREYSRYAAARGVPRKPQQRKRQQAKVQRQRASAGAVSGKWQPEQRAG